MFFILFPVLVLFFSFYFAIFSHFDLLYFVVGFFMVRFCRKRRKGKNLKTFYVTDVIYFKAKNWRWNFFGTFLDFAGKTRDEDLQQISKLHLQKNYQRRTSHQKNTFKKLTPAVGHLKKIFNTFTIGCGLLEKYF